ncbi:MAG: ADP-ribose pyrophosphatase [Blastocatellia bacterium]|nr:MAG: ADP-ribose pyrophosphatase [Blastocatellia bacterium]
MSIVFAGRVFSVELEDVILPNGRRFSVETVRHPPSVVLLPMADSEHVMLVRQYRHSIRRKTWELPAGSLDPGESAESAAIRECEEEIRLVPGRTETLGRFFPATGFCDEELIYFRAWDLRPPPPHSPHFPDEDEDIYVQAFTIVEARAMAARGEIIDLKTAYGLTLL